MVCRFYISEKTAIRLVGYNEGCCSLGSSSIKPLCNGGNDETKCGLAIVVIKEFEKYKYLRTVGVKKL